MMSNSDGKGKRADVNQRVLSKIGLLQPLSSTESRILSHIALLLRKESGALPLLQPNNSPRTFLNSIVDSICWRCLPVSHERARELQSQAREQMLALPTSPLEELALFFHAHNYELKRLQGSLSAKARLGAIKLESVARVGTSALFSKWQAEGLHTLLRNNAPVQALFASLDGKPGISAHNFNILYHLSGHRFPSDNRTLWEASGQIPKDDEIDALLEMTQKIDLVRAKGAFISSALFTIIRRFSTTLLSTKSGRSLLAAPTYRKVLWECLDGVLWHELIRCLFASLTESGSIVTVGHFPAPRDYLWLISEFGYVSLGIERDIQIHEHFRRAAQHEALLYHSRMGYRDHLFHAINTFLFGFGLLTAKASPFASVSECNSVSIAKQDQLLRSWFLTSLFHDFGYVMDVVPSVQRIADKFRMGRGDQIAANLNEAWAAQLKEVNCEIEKECHLQAPLGKRPNHGVFSYLHLRKILDDLDSPVVPDQKRKTLIARSAKKFRETYANALSAILKHSLLLEPISIKIDSLAGILVVCDEIQEWLRPSYGSWPLAESMISLINFQQMLSLNPRRVCEALEIDGIRVSDGQIVFQHAKGHPSVTVRLRYADQNVNVFEPLSRLLSKIYNLERVEGLHKISLKLELQMPWLTGPRLQYPTEMSELAILRDFCLLCESGISPKLYSSGDKPPRDRGHCYCYWTSLRGRKYDVITLDLSHFPAIPRKNPLVSRPPWEFQEQLWEFKRDYCRRKGILCSFFDGDDDWPFQQIGSV